MKTPNKEIGLSMIQRKSSNEAVPQWQNSSLAEHIKYCLRSLLFTRVGERKYLPKTGTKLMTFFFRQSDATLLQSLKTEIEKSIRVFEPRITLQSVDFHESEAEPHVVQFSIYYQIHATGSRDHMSIRVQP